MSIRYKALTLKGLTRHFQSGTVVVSPPTSVTSNPGTVLGPFANQQADGGYQTRTSEQTYTGNTLVSTVYPAGTKLVSGEFDSAYLGYQDKTFTVTPTTTFAEILLIFTNYFGLTPLDAVGDPVDVSADPDAPFYLKGTSSDGGSYDIVYVDTDGVQYHADKFFVPDAQDRPSEYQFDYLLGALPGGGGGNNDGPPPGAFQEHVGKRYLRRSDELVNIVGSAIRTIRLSVYEQGNPTPFTFEYSVYGMQGEHNTVGEMLDFFSSVRMSAIPWTLQRVEGTTSAQERTNTEGYLHIVDQGFNQIVVSELNSDGFGLIAPDLWGNNGQPPGASPSENDALPFNTFDSFVGGIFMTRSTLLTNLDPDMSFVELSSYLGATRPADHVTRVAVRYDNGNPRTVGDLIDFINADTNLLFVTLAADPESPEPGEGVLQSGYFQVTAYQGLFALEQLDIDHSEYGSPGFFA